MPRFLTMLLWLVCLTIPVASRAIDSAAPAVLQPGGMRIIAAAGPAIIARDTTFDIEASFRVGLAERVELAAPLALGIRLVDAWPGSALYLGVGVVDLSITPDSRVLFSPSAMLAGHIRLGHESALRAAFDLTGAEESFSGNRHPFWLRGSLAVLIDMGPWLTLAGGIAYQRLTVGGDPPDDAHSTGWVSDSRFSVGAVRSQPFYDLPTLSIHVASFFDIIVIMRVDIDMETRTTDQRWLFGMELKKQ